LVSFDDIWKLVPAMGSVAAPAPRCLWLIKEEYILKNVANQTVAGPH